MLSSWWRDSDLDPHPGEDGSLCTLISIGGKSLLFSGPVSILEESIHLNDMPRTKCTHFFRQKQVFSSETIPCDFTRG